MPERLGLVLTGGGNKCAVTVGALQALYYEHGIEAPHVIVAASGSVGPALHYMARRFKEMDQWPKLFDSRRYVSIMRFWRMMDIDVLVDDILRPLVPALGREASHSPSRLFVATTDARTGAVRWFSNEHLYAAFELKRASCAVPGIYGKAVSFNGYTLCDGSFSVQTSHCIGKAYAEGAERVIVVDASGSRAESRYVPLTLWLLTRRQGKRMQAIVRRYLLRGGDPISDAEGIIVCRPRVLAVRHALDTNEQRLRQTIAQGYAAMASLKI
jgi:predicted patatin/cPLA2 family phospholipase